jgi:hypothetical protein
LRPIARSSNCKGRKFAGRSIAIYTHSPFASESDPNANVNSGCNQSARDSDSYVYPLSGFGFILPRGLISASALGLCSLRSDISVSHFTMSFHRGIGYDPSILQDDALAILGTRLENSHSHPRCSPETSIQRQKCLSHPRDHNQRCGFGPRTQSYRARLDGSRAQ